MPSISDSLQGRRGTKEPVDRVRELEEQLLKVLPLGQVLLIHGAHHPQAHSLLCPCSQGDTWSSAFS